MNKRTSNIEHPTPNFDGSANPRSLRRSMFGVRRSMFSLGSGVSTRECSFRGNLSRNRERVAGDRVRGRLMVPEQFQKEQEAIDELRTLAQRKCKRYHYPGAPVLDTSLEAIVKLLPQLK